MTSNEVSSEIVKLEREVSELKREYKNLLAKAQVRPQVDCVGSLTKI